MLKKIILLLVISFCEFYAQEGLNEMRIVGKPEILKSEFISNNNKDINGNVCAGLKIVTDLTGFSYRSNNGIVKIDKQPGRDVLYLSPDERVVEVYCTGFKPLKIYLYDAGISLQSRAVWKVEVTGDKKSDEISIIIRSEPADANIYLDGKEVKSGVSVQTGAGSHSLRISKSGYREVIENIEVSPGNILFERTLAPIDPVGIVIKTAPTGARILINNFDEGLSDLPLFKYPGRYNLRITKSGYVDINEELEITETGKKEFLYSLIENAGTLKLSVTPADANILLNKKDYTGQKNIRLAPGPYKVELSKTGYRDFSETITITQGKTLTKTYSLEAVTGVLQFTIKPVEAQVKLKRNGNTVEEWKGMKFLRNLVIGEYQLEASAPGYGKHSGTIKIAEGKTTIENIELIKETAQSAGETGGKAGENMVFVKGGWFEMGSNDGRIFEKPVHRVWVDDFYIGKYEVTNAEYCKFLNVKGNKIEGGKEWIRLSGKYDDEKCRIYKSGGRFKVESGYERYPVIYVNWYGAKAYCEWAGGRLPTEAEWEYAAKGGEKSRGYEYSGSNDIGTVAWYKDNSRSKTHPVGSKSPNELGIYDMSGNVFEWCNDRFGDFYYNNSPKRNPKGETSGSLRSLRGGSWAGNTCRSYHRGWCVLVDSGNSIGFRLVRD